MLSLSPAMISLHGWRTLRRAKWMKDYPVWPFDMPQEVCLQMSFGGWAASCTADDNVLPQSTVVDWVKYYKLKK